MKHEESQLQQMCVKWFRLQYPELSLLLFSVPNGGARSRKEAAIMKGEGATAGVADLILLVPRGEFSSLCLEMKTEKGKQSDSQKTWQDAAESVGNCYMVIRSLDEFMDAVKLYLSQG